MSKNVRALKAKFLTPTMVLENALLDVADLEQVFIVALSKDPEENFRVMMSGNLETLPKASLILHGCAMDFAHGVLDDDGDF